jgi:GH25 family lysozyme M1 (1,4-beta-N-acetylmuramidase)
MKKLILSLSLCIVMSPFMQAQECLNAGFCTASTNQYPTSTFSTTTSSWTTVSAYMNAGNYTLFNVTSGNVYEWTYCEAYGGTSGSWDAQLTLTNNATSANLCFSDNKCGTSGKAPYISWTATFTGVVRVLTTVSNCASNTGSPYNTLVWRQANGGASTAILGIDVSHYDGTITWSQVKSAPKLFAWAKASEGTTNTDATFAANAANGNAAGVYVGGYHFAHPETNAASTEATFFMSIAGSYIKNCNLMPALDLEDPAGGPSLISSMTSAALTSWVQAWMSAVKNQGGVTPILYTSGSIASYLGSAVNIYPLWIADPDGSSSAPPANTGVWTNWAFKQYSWTGTVPGITGQVDMNVFNGDMNAFNALIGCAVTGLAEEKALPEFKLFPNPANDHITIENVVFDENAADVISVYNMQGQLILSQRAQQTEIDISGFKTGLYVVRLQTSQGMQVKKFLKQ